MAESTAGMDIRDYLQQEDEKERQKSKMFQAGQAVNRFGNRFNQAAIGVQNAALEGNAKLYEKHDNINEAGRQNFLRRQLENTRDALQQAKQDQRDLRYNRAQPDVARFVLELQQKGVTVEEELAAIQEDIGKLEAQEAIYMHRLEATDREGQLSAMEALREITYNMFAKEGKFRAGLAKVTRPIGEFFKGLGEKFNKWRNKGEAQQDALDARLEALLDEPSEEGSPTEVLADSELGEERKNALFDKLKAVYEKGGPKKVKEILESSPEARASVLSILFGGTIRGALGVAGAPALVAMREGYLHWNATQQDKANRAEDDGAASMSREAFLKKYARVERVGTTDMPLHAAETPVEVATEPADDIDARDFFDRLDEDEKKNKQPNWFLKQGGRLLKFGGDAATVFVRAGERIALQPNKKLDRVSSAMEGLLLYVDDLTNEPTPEQMEAAIQRWLGEKFSKQAMEDPSALGKDILQLSQLLEDLLDLQLMGDYVSPTMGEKIMKKFGQKGENYFANPQFIALARENILNYLGAERTLKQKLSGLSTELKNSSGKEAKKARLALEHLNNMRHDAYLNAYLDKRANQMWKTLGATEAVIVLLQATATAGVGEMLRGQMAASEGVVEGRAPGSLPVHEDKDTLEIPVRGNVGQSTVELPQAAPAAESTTDFTPLSPQNNEYVATHGDSLNIGGGEVVDYINRNGTFNLATLEGQGGAFFLEQTGFPNLGELNAAGLRAIEGIQDGTFSQVLNATNDLSRELGRTFTQEELTLIVDAFNGRYGGNVQEWMRVLGNTHEGLDRADDVLRRIGITG